MAKVSVICSAYQRPRQIEVLLHCFLCQTYTDWEIHVMHDSVSEEIRKIVTGFNDKRIFYHESEIRYNDFGHTLREQGLNFVTGDYLMWTNDDNYYVPVFLERMLNNIQSGDYDFVYCDMVHSHEDYHVLVTQPAFCKIDMGAFIVKTSIAQEVRFPDRDFCADGKFVERVMALEGIRTVKVEQILFVHN